MSASAAPTGWGRDDLNMTMLENTAQWLMAEAARVKAGQVPLVGELVRDFIDLCHKLNIERNGPDRVRTTRLLADVDLVRDELRRLWGNPRLDEVKAQLLLIAPAHKELNDRLNDQWSECRSESTAERCAQLRHALHLRQRQLAERAPLAAGRAV